MNRKEKRAKESRLYFKAFYYQQTANLRRAKTVMTSIFKLKDFDFSNMKFDDMGRKK